jgi:hypothetical protein
LICREEVRIGDGGIRAGQTERERERERERLEEIMLEDCRHSLKTEKRD